MSRNPKGKDGKEDVTFYKMKVKDLEGEVSRLKQRLNDLRKAKNSVMIKREREIIHVGHPQTKKETKVEPPPHKDPQPKAEGGVQPAKYKELEDKLIASQKEKDDLSAKVKELLDQRLLLNRDLLDERRKGEGYKEELDALLERLELKSTQQETKHVENNRRETYINDLMNENASLRKKNDQLIDDLSVKEAKWVEKEEIFKQRESTMHKSWNDKYAKWMSDTEKKIEELKQQNLMLRDCLNRGAPRQSSNEKEQDPKKSK